jgi:hypothetical protein
MSTRDMNKQMFLKSRVRSMREVNILTAICEPFFLYIVGS